MPANVKNSTQIIFTPTGFWVEKKGESPEGHQIPAAPGSTHRTGSETPAAPGSTHRTGSETPAAPDSTRQLGSEVPAAPGAVPGKERWTGGDVYKELYDYALSGNTGNATPSERFLFMVADEFFKELTEYPGLELLREVVNVIPDKDTLERLLSAAPFAVGAEYITEAWIIIVFYELKKVFSREIEGFDGSVELYFAEKNQNLRVPEKVFFHLVENKNDEVYPFAFLATYATQDEEGRVRHVPLKYALTEYGGERDKLLTLLSCLNKVAAVSDLIGGFIASGELFHPLRMSAQEAYTFLSQVDEIEKTGVLCRIPNWWRKKSAAVTVTVKLGENQPARLGFDALVSAVPTLTLDGTTISREDVEKLLSQTEGLALLKGKWVEVNHAKLHRLLEQMEDAGGEMTLMEALQMELKEEGEPEVDIGGLVSNGKWLSDLLMQLRHPEKIKKAAVPRTLKAQLRPYQKNGFAWLGYMDSLGFGACLADDMGLGKTVQVLAYLEKLRKSRPEGKVLLIVPASLIGNWKSEADKFAPSMDLKILHGKSAALLEDEVKNPAFLNITTYGMAARVKNLAQASWDCIILDEAQAIKNPGTKQTREIKKLSGRMRIAMTGTPIENDLTNLWSLFDFLNKGLLGTSMEFKRYCSTLSEHPEKYDHLRAMVAPFMLRRVKTDKNIIADLPDKLETVDHVGLSKKQVVLYRKVVTDMEAVINELDGIDRRGVVLATIMKLKQICNHPDQYLGQETYAPADSGKFIMLKELCETIYEKRERVLVFTQFREITEQLSAYLGEIFHHRGYVIHGGIPAKKRTEIVEKFQGDAYVPYLVISVKAGGVGLNLTKANHVIHFDRWWNPAVENQATDRAFRIGQTKNVMVHKLACTGTVEEKIDAIIESKKELAENVIGSGGEKWITELGNEELISLLRLEG